MVEALSKVPQPAFGGLSIETYLPALMLKFRSADQETSSYRISCHHMLSPPLATAVCVHQSALCLTFVQLS